MDGSPAAPFRPAWWLPGRHAQTLGARGLRSRLELAYRRERVELRDGDFVDIDWPQLDGVGRNATDPLVLLLHGLEGSARSGYARQSYRALAAVGVEAVGMNFRSCSGELNRLPRLYHSGETGDLRAVLDLLRERFPQRPLGAVGFSLGGNVLLKYLGEQGTDTPIEGAVAISVPFDLAAGADLLERGFARFYAHYLLRKLRRKVAAKAATLDALVDVPAVLGSRTFWEFDDRGTARLHGFADASDYYARSSSGPYLADISVPTLLIQARDDPFLPARALPAVRELDEHPWITAEFCAGGGHVGFVGGQPWAPVFWAEATAARFLAARLRADQRKPARPD